MVRASGFTMAILPLGATEPHNLHLPYATDNFEAEWIVSEIAEAAWQQGARPVVLPVIPYGTETNMQRFPLAMNIMPSTLFRVIEDLLQSVAASGIRKLLILNSHGGNELKPLLRELYGKTQVQLFLCNWFQMVRDVSASIFERPDDHAGEMETSMILAYRPELVAKTSNGDLKADEGTSRSMRFEALEKGWVSITRPWHLLTTNSGCGNPHAASAEKGLLMMERIRERLVPFIVQLSNTPIDETFPFQESHARIVSD
jgi:creatinine amidohydrolase